MTSVFPISKIGPGQLVDVKHSGTEVHDQYFRTCTVLQGDPPTSHIGDTAPYRLVDLYGNTWQHWNRHFVVQVAGCPLDCWYCYVDNLKEDRWISAADLTEEFIKFKRYVPDLNVLHFMGGCPGRYAHEWPNIRYCLDMAGLHDTILLSDVILVEFYLYNERPWLTIPQRSLISVSLKGTNFHNFARNTGANLFAQVLSELQHYIQLGGSAGRQIYFSLTEWDKEDTPFIQALLGGSHRIDWMKVKEYEVVKVRQRGHRRSNG